jgi:arsenite-transporting ATPase
MVPQHIFFLGKGGVGKSTISALNALSISRKNKSVLLVSLDPAHNLHDIFQTKIGEKPKKIAENLLVIQIDHTKWIRRYLSKVQKIVDSTYRYLTSVNLDHYFDILKYSPGIEEYALLLAFEEIAEKYHDKVNSIIFDMPPTALSLKFFRLPGLSLQWLEKLLELRNEIIHKRELITKVKLGKKEFQTDKVLKSLMDQRARYRRMQDIFENKRAADIGVVVNPDKLAIGETDEIIRIFRELNIPVGQIIMNKIQGVGDDIWEKKYSDFDCKKYFLADYELVGLENLRHYLSCDSR